MHGVFKFVILLLFQNQNFTHFSTGYEFDYVFDWTVLKYKQGQKQKVQLISFCVFFHWGDGADGDYCLYLYKAATSVMCLCRCLQLFHVVDSVSCYMSSRIECIMQNPKTIPEPSSRTNKAPVISCYSCTIYVSVVMFC